MRRWQGKPVPTSICPGLPHDADLMPRLNDVRYRLSQGLSPSAMTVYLNGGRPRELPPFPEIRIDAPSQAMAEAACAYLATVDSDDWRDFDADTFGTERPGADPSVLMTDREFAMAVIVGASSGNAHWTARVAPEASPTHGEAGSPPQHAAYVAEGAGTYEDVTTPPALRRRTGAINSQLLRTAAFCNPPLDVNLPLVGDRQTFRVAVSVVSLAQDHLDVLLFIMSRLPLDPERLHHSTVTLHERELLQTMGWGVNSKNFARLRRTLAELCAARFTLIDTDNPKQTALERVALIETKPLPSTGTQRRATEVHVLPAIHAMLRLRRNTIIDLAARAAIRSEFGRWLHAFASSQKAGLLRTYAAADLCRAGGLRAERLTDDLKSLRANLTVLEAGTTSRPSRSTKLESGHRVKEFRACVRAGWTVNDADCRWQASFART